MKSEFLRELTSSQIITTLHHSTSCPHLLFLRPRPQLITNSPSITSQKNTVIENFGFDLRGITTRCTRFIRHFELRLSTMRLIRYA